jgi:cell wall-associated NlpC family hydrolase
MEAGMRRGLISLLVALALLVAAPAAHSASWAQAQIRVVVDRGIMGPSVAAFRPNDPLTRRVLGQVMASLTDEPRVVVDPDRRVLLWELDRALVGAAGVRPAARRFQRKAIDAGLQPPGRFGSEVVARLLRLRFNHPAARDYRELRPQDVVTRAETAYSVARVLELSDWDRDYVTGLADSLAFPSFTAWQRRLLARAFRFVGYPYVWGGTSESRQTLFGVTSRGGFDCSGFVWRVYKLEPFAGAPQLQSVLRGRTTYELSGEFPRAQRIPRDRLRPADLVFFGVRGRRSLPSEVTHMGIYVGGGWMVHSSGNGVTLVPMTGWYADRFAWGRRPLREAGLA